MISRFPLMVKFLTQHPKSPIVTQGATSSNSKCMAVTNGQLVPAEQVRNFADKVFGKDRNQDPFSQPIPPGFSGEEKSGELEDKSKKQEEEQLKKKPDANQNPPKKE